MPVIWKSAEGFTTMCLFLDSLGEYGEYVMLYNEATQTPMDVKEWMKRKYKAKSCLLIRHSICGGILQPSIDNVMRRGRGFRCPCTRSYPNYWRDHREEVVAMGVERGFRVLTNAEEWKASCTGNTWHPQLQCCMCEQIVTTTCISSLKGGGKVGCKCNNTRLYHWRDRRDEIVAIGQQRGFTVVTTQEEWYLNCTGYQFMPQLQCVQCKDIVASTNINSIQRGGGAGCRCNSHHANNWNKRYDEFVETCRTYNVDVLTINEEWNKTCQNSKWCPTLRCTLCDDIITTTVISSALQGTFGCKCRSNYNWCDRRHEIVAMGIANGFELLSSEEEFFELATAKWCPTLKCNTCGDIVQTTSLARLPQSNQAACRCNSNHARLFRERRDEIEEIGQRNGFTIVTTAQEWFNECLNASFKPVLQCVTCNDTVTTTSVDSLVNGHFGCRNCNGTKTEAKLHGWLNLTYPSATIQRQYKGPICKGQTYFDFQLTFADGFEVIVELDGEQHFWFIEHFCGNTTNFKELCERDFAKEKWAIEQHISVVRILQIHVWKDQYNWQHWLTQSIEAARMSDPRVFTPDAPEYRSTESGYVKKTGLR